MIGLEKIKWLLIFLYFHAFFSAIELATTKPTQQNIAEIINYDSSLTKIPASHFDRVKIAWYESIRPCFMRI